MSNSPKERVEIELHDLEEKAVKLGKFIISNEFEKLSIRMRNLLCKQYGCMCSYAKILRERLEIWEQKS